MRTLIVCNFVTVDGYYEAEDKTIDGLFEHQHPDDAGDDSFDHYTTERLRAADAPGEIAGLKRGAGRDVLILLGRVLWNALLQHGLVDELHLVIFPIVAGDGVKLFDGRPAASLRLIHTRQWQGSGNTLACYRVTAAPDTA